jgi:hypothetical protein
MFREIMAIRTSQMMTSRSLICLLENQNGGKLQKNCFSTKNKEVNHILLLIFPEYALDFSAVFSMSELDSNIFRSHKLQISTL